MSSVTLPATALQLNAFDNLAGVVSGLQACSTAWSGGGAYNVDKQRGDSWATGGMAMTLFNTVASPNVNNDEWAYCAKGGGTEANFSNAESYHSGGVNCLLGDGSVKFIKDSTNQRIWWSLGTCAGGEIIDASSY